ncbi:MAG: family 78 glycoside hydrolase catalytic domain [Planctomycetales bacterium]|nr:family 78 glycoside hydrolase catalytic domain [Planctomycetales bacterium]
MAAGLRRGADWRRGTTALLLVLLTARAGLGFAAESATLDRSYRTVRLRCEGADDPLGVDVAQPQLSWQVVGDQPGQRQTAYRVLVASTAETLDENRGYLWDSGKCESPETTGVAYAGQPLKSSQQAFWKVQSWDAAGQPSPWSDPATWTMGVVRRDDWQARWIVAPWTSEALLMRREFNVRPGLRRAVAHVTGLGQFEFFLNGEKVSANLLSPGWTKYNRTCLYETHDVTDLLKPGDNAVGLALGDGMYCTERRNRFSKFQGTFGPQRAFGQIELEYDDGSREVIATDPSWRVSRGPVTYNDIYGGEDYDARLFEPGWNSPGFDDAAWTNAVELVRPSGELRGLSASAPPLGEIEIIEPIAMNESDGYQVVDFGQNASYMPRITVSGPAGSTIRLTHAEVLDENGRIDRGTCGGNRGPAYWQYTKATDELETWFPQFFYAGCRYLQVDRFPPESGGAQPRLERCDGVVVHSIAAPTGRFECSNELLNRIRTLVRWAQRSNMVSVLTDCPHREKLGWLEQYHLNGPAIRYEFDVPQIFAKGTQDMADSQLANGLVPNIAPEYVEFPGTFRAAAEWGSAVILVPWQQYLFTGDRTLLVRHYEHMARYLGYLQSIAEDGIVSEGLGDWYDLGPADRPGHAQLTPPPQTATAFYFYDAKLMAEIATLTGHDEDAAKYAELAESVRRAWLREFRSADGVYGTNSQCINAMALEMDLVLPEDRSRVFTALVDDVENNDNATTAGDVGHRYVLQALAHGGRSDVIYKMINQDQRPGYGYQLKQGATSLTEAWDANHHSSHNHFMLGHITEWFYGRVLGIRPDPAAPGFKRVIIEPTPGGDLAWAKGSYNGPYGRIAVRWDLSQDDRFRLRVTIPANSTALVILPADGAETIRVDGVAVADAKGVEMEAADARQTRLVVPSGTYEFECRYAGSEPR